MTPIKLYDRRDWLQYATVERPAAFAVYHRTLTLIVPRWNHAYDLILDNRLDTVIRYGGHIWDVETVTNTADQITLIACRYAFDQLTEPWTFDSYLAARTPKENPMPDTIDPTTCKPGEYYLVETAGREFLGERVDPEDYLQWRLNRPASVWVRDVDVTVLHRLVPEVDDVVDAEVEEDWTILRKAADAILHSGYDPTTLTTVLDVADYLTGQAGRIEADHRVAQEKAAADVARDAREADIWHHLSLAAGGPVDTHGDAVDAIASLRRETDQAGQAELRVRLLHSPVDCRCGCGNTICTECPSENHPCPTIRALEGEADRG